MKLSKMAYVDFISLAIIPELSKIVPLERRNLMKDSIGFKALLLIAVISTVAVFVLGCERIEAKKQLAQIREDALTTYVNLPNPNGSYTPVAIRREGNVYIGPHGEQYTTYPTVEQLTPLYGIK
jgi:hypothetical protein